MTDLLLDQGAAAIAAAVRAGEASARERHGWPLLVVARRAEMTLA